MNFIYGGTWKLIRKGTTMQICKDSVQFCSLELDKRWFLSFFFGHLLVWEMRWWSLFGDSNMVEYFCVTAHVGRPASLCLYAHTPHVIWDALIETEKNETGWFQTMHHNSYVNSWNIVKGKESESKTQNGACFCFREKNLCFFFILMWWNLDEPTML